MFSTIFTYLILVVVGFVMAMAIYITTNRGIPDRSIHQQSSRFAIASAISMLPTTVGGMGFLCPQILLSAVIALLWMVTYPLLYHLTNRKVSSEYDNKIDEAFGLYLFGMLTAIEALTQGNMLIVDILMAVASFILLFIPLFQIVWYAIYHTCIDVNGIKILQETNVNECIEFVKSFSFWKLLLMAIPIVLICLACAFTCINGANPYTYNIWQTLTCAVILIVLLYETLRPGKGALWRTGIVELYLNVKEYVANNKMYAAEQQKRFKTLVVEQLNESCDKRPKTILMVVGESACRDYMSAWHPEMEHDTTPWMRQMAATDENAIVFPHAYSCAIQTVPSLEKALTEANQYNGKPFYESCSIIDIAHKLGYRVRWYSNQGHLGVSETPVTLVADTADVDKWTHQEVGKVQYDENLLSFLNEVNPQENNFLILHLKGSHFNYLNRYPSTFTRWGEPGVQDDVVNYKNSLAYTDYVLQKAYEYCRKNLNLQAMIYFSDHGNEPGKRRQPAFSTFQMTRIPLFVWLSDSYAKQHAERTQALKANHDKYFTNDLAYELVCGIFDIRSNHFDDKSSLTSNDYRFQRKDLLTYEGKVRIEDDTQDDSLSSHEIN